MDVFLFRNLVIKDYQKFTRSFSRPAAEDIAGFVAAEYARERFWPSPLIHLNPSFVSGETVEDLAGSGLLHAECRRIFRTGKTEEGGFGAALRLHKHQEEAIRIAKEGNSYVLTTGTGSGKSLSYFIPIVDHVLRARERGERRGVTAIVVYPMNALCNSQAEELRKFLTFGYPKGQEPVAFQRYTGEVKSDDRMKMAENPPDILLTNYMMLELLLTRQELPDSALVHHAEGLRFLVLDELHTYRGRQGADVALLVRRVRERMNPDLLAVGTSATMSSEGTAEDRNRTVAAIASRLFGGRVDPRHVVTESLERATPEDVVVTGATLAGAITAGIPEKAAFDALRRNPVAAWVETTLGLEQEQHGRLVRRSRPLDFAQAVALLSEHSGRPVAECRDFLTRFLL